MIWRHKYPGHGPWCHLPPHMRPGFRYRTPMAFWGPHPYWCAWVPWNRPWWVEGEEGEAARSPPATEKEYLESLRDYLSRELEAVNKRLEELREEDSD